MVPAAIKIQLEGAYERVEAAEARLRLAAKVLRRFDWYRRPGWVTLEALTVAEREAVEAVRRKNAESCAALAGRFDKTERQLHAALEARLKEWGEPVIGSVADQVKLLGTHLPIAFTDDSRTAVTALAVVIAGVGVTFGAVFRIEAGIALCVLAGVSLLVGHAVASPVQVTNKVLLAEGLAVPFAKIAEVQIEYQDTRRCTVDVTSVTGPHRQVWMSETSGQDLAKALRGRGVTVSECRPGFYGFS